MPSVRGRERLTTVSLLVISGTLSGALIGFAAGSLGQLVPEPSLGAIALLVVGAVVLDLGHRRFPGLRPFAVGTQVPIEWGRLFSAPVVAVLYGSRLGVGPLTILSTWLWWAMTIGSALMGVGVSVTVGAVFGFTRLSSTVAASMRAERAGHAAWFGRLRANAASAWLGLDVASIVLLVAVALSQSGRR